MTLVATDVARVSNAIKHEYDPATGFTRKTLTVYEATAQTYVGGSAVLARTLASGACTPAAVTGNTGNGTMGAVTVYPTAKLGYYLVRVVATATNAGVIAVFYPNGTLVGYGNVAAAFVGGGLSFTLADGSTDFAVGDAFTLPVTGTERYSRVAAASDLSDVAVFISDVVGNTGAVSIAATTDTTVLALVRGPAIVADTALTFNADVNTAAEKAAVYAALEAKGILVAPAL